ncbi:MAG: chorismate mutase [Vulcanimicrobiaceae bacterium]
MSPLPNRSVRSRGIRGAITVTENSAQAIGDATQHLLREIVSRNHIELDEITSVLFSLTADLYAQFPALFAREMGWVDVPMLHFTEVAVPGSMERCIRVLVHVNTPLAQSEISHVYLGGAVALRPDLAKAAT